MRREFRKKKPSVEKGENRKFITQRGGRGQKTTDQSTGGCGCSYRKKIKYTSPKEGSPSQKKDLEKESFN